MSDNDFSGSATDTDIISAQHFWTGGLGTAGPGCHDAVAIARTAGFRMLVMSPHPSCGDCPLTAPQPAKKSGQNIPKNRCRTTIAERMGETPAELPFIGDQVVCLSHNQAARSGPRKEARARGSARDQLKPPHPGGATTVGPSGSRRDFGGTSGRCQSVRRRNQPMPSAIKKVSIGVSATPATTNQNCVSERLRIGMMSHAEDALTRPRREK